MMTKTITFTGTNKKLSVCTGIHINKLIFVVDILLSSKENFYSLSIANALLNRTACITED